MYYKHQPWSDPNQSLPRVQLIDIAKGISILLVVAGHTDAVRSTPELNRILGTFRLPFFFFLSGIFFNSTRDIKTTLFGKSDALLKPYFSTFLFVVAIQAMLDYSLLPGMIKGILYATGPMLPWRWAPLWFLPHLWLLFIFCWAYIRTVNYSKQPILAKMANLAFFLLIGPLLLRAVGTVSFDIGGNEMFVSGLPFSMNLLLISAIYFLLGFTLHEQMVSFKPQRYGLLLAILSFSLAQIFSRPRVDLNMRLYSPALIATVAALSGIYLTLSFAFLLQKSRIFCSSLSFIGAKSLYLFIFHVFFYQLSLSTLQKAPFQTPMQLASWLSFILCIALSLLLSGLIRRTPCLAPFYVPKKLLHR